MAEEQIRTTAQDLLVSFGARFNAEAVRLADQIHSVIADRGAKIAELEKRIVELEAQIVPKDDDVK